MLNDKSSFHGVPELLMRLPLTLLLFALILGLGIMANAHLGELDTWIHRRVGYSTRLLFEGEAHRILVSLLFTAGGVAFYQSLAMLAWIVGWTEWHYGTRLTAWVFFGVHVTTIIIMSLLIAWPLASIGAAHGQVLFSERDVGPSAGYYGCLGFSVAMITQRSWRQRLMSAVGLILVLRLGWSSWQLEQTSGGAFSADLAHTIAFPLGALLSNAWKRRRSPNGHEATALQHSRIDE